MAFAFIDAKRFVACPVLVSEIVVHKDATYPGKIKAPRCCAPIWEVNIDGERIEAPPKPAEPG